MGKAGFAIAHLHASKALEFKYYMFEDMSEVGSAFESLEKATGFTNAATVFEKGRNPEFESIVKAGKFSGGGIFEGSKV
jgi:hypothetical protein